MERVRACAFVLSDVQCAVVILRVFFYSLCSLSNIWNVHLAWIQSRFWPCTNVTGPYRGGFDRSWSSLCACDIMSHFLISFLSPLNLTFSCEEEDSLVTGKSTKPPAAPPAASGPRATRVNTKIVVYSPQDTSSSHSQGSPSCTLSDTSTCLACLPLDYMLCSPLMIRMRRNCLCEYACVLKGVESG